MKNNLQKQISTITNGERFITPEQLEQLEELNGIWIENCGTSGTGQGTLFTLYLMNEYGNKTEELCEVVVKY